MAAVKILSYRGWYFGTDADSPGLVLEDSAADMLCRKIRQRVAPGQVDIGMLMSAPMSSSSAAIA
jgi:hypothetical protein